MTRTKKLFGLWDSQISAANVAAGLRLSSVAWDTDGQTLVWLEGRSGKGVVVVLEPALGAPRDLTGDLDVRGEVGYGGGDLTVHDGIVYFAVRGDGRLHRQALSGGSARPITPQFGKAAAPVVAPSGRWVAYVHHDEERIDRIAVVDCEGSIWPQILTSGHDFYAQPRWSPDGSLFVWVAWDHPSMPWDESTLYIADVIQREGGLPELGEPRLLAGGAGVSVSQAEFTPDGRELLFISDETGKGRLTALDLATGNRRRLTWGQSDYSSALWAQGLSTLAVSADGHSAYLVGTDGGFRTTVRVEVAGAGEEVPVAAMTEYTDVEGLIAAPNGDRVAAVASAPATPPRVVWFEGSSETAEVAARSTGETVAPEFLSEPQAVSWRTAGDETAHGLYYPPTNPAFEGIGLPPLVVLVHGGPTSHARARWDPAAQYFATRGYAVLQLNYRGSTGYGRAYTQRLRGCWGVCDVEDSVSGARHLIDAGLVDPDRTVIMGGSAGGYTVLQTMIDAPEAFSAAICMYGVSNLFSLASDTHKFEERYLDSLVGSLPDSANLYRARSPEFHAAKIRRPMAVFQGEDDTVVPRSQSDTIVAALERSGVPHVYHVYAGEGHGWRKSDTIEHFWKAVEEFLRRHLLYS